MKCSSTVSIFLLGFVAAGCQNENNTAAVDTTPEPAPVVEQATPISNSPAATGPQTTTEASLLSASDWVVLFDGHDLASFDRLGEAQWNIVDGYVEADDYMSSFLLSRGAYTNFRLRVEFWPGPGANSGVFIRCDDRNVVQPAHNKCYEINIFDNNPNNPANSTGAIVNFVPPAVSVEAEQQWNVLDIVANGSDIAVTLNGIVTAELKGDDTHAAGPFALQNHGGVIRFRRIELQPL